MLTSLDLSAVSTLVVMESDQLTSEDLSVLLPSSRTSISVGDNLTFLCLGQLTLVILDSMSNCRPFPSLETCRMGVHYDVAYNTEHAQTVIESISSFIGRQRSVRTLRFGVDKEDWADVEELDPDGILSYETAFNSDTFINALKKLKKLKHLILNTFRFSDLHPVLSDAFPQDLQHVISITLHTYVALDLGNGIVSEGILSFLHDEFLISAFVALYRSTNFPKRTPLN